MTFELRFAFRIHPCASLFCAEDICPLYFELIQVLVVQGYTTR